MKLVFILLLLGFVGYVGFLLSKLHAAFHKHLLTFVRHHLYVLLLVLFIGIAGLVYMAYYTSAFDRQCINTHKPTTEPPNELKEPKDYLQLGDYDYQRGDCIGALEDYSQAIVRNLNFSEAYNNRAYTNMRMRNYAFALLDLNHAISLRPDYVSALMNRGDIYNYYYQIDKRKAIADYDRVISARHFDPSNSVCGHRAVAIYSLPGQIGWNVLSYIQFIFHSRTYGCTMTL